MIIKLDVFKEMAINRSLTREAKEITKAEFDLNIISFYRCDIYEQELQFLNEEGIAIIWWNYRNGGGGWVYETDYRVVKWDKEGTEIITPNEFLDKMGWAINLFVTERDRNGYVQRVQTRAFIPDYTKGEKFIFLSDTKTLYALDERWSKDKISQVIYEEKYKELVESIKEAINGLEATRSQFRSKKVKDIRIKLEQAIA